MPIEYEPFSAGWRADPYPAYRELREHAPLHYAPESECYCLSWHEDVLFALNHPELFSSRAMFTVIFNNGFEGRPPVTWDTVKFLVRFALATRANPLGFQDARNLVASDPPVHGELRSIVNRGFTPRRIQAWEPRIREIAAEQATPLGRGEPFDVVGDFAIPLPVRIIAEMLGVEPARFEEFKRWSDAVIEGATGSKRGFPPHPETLEAFVDGALTLAHGKALFRDATPEEAAAHRETLLREAAAAAEGSGRFGARPAALAVLDDLKKTLDEAVETPR